MKKELFFFMDMLCFVVYQILKTIIDDVVRGAMLDQTG
jgi:hypothetical protein